MLPRPATSSPLKVAAARVDRDADDIRFLADVCGLRTAAEIVPVTEEVMGGRQLPRAQFLIEELFGGDEPEGP